MDEAGTQHRAITVRTDSPEAGSIRLSIRDTGPGIAEQMKEELFSPFFTTKAAGMGMGLSICRSVMEARGGSLTGESHPDGGSIFTISIPVPGEVEHV